MCKHVAAVFYGIGARPDERPELLFKLRKVDEKELIAKAGRGLPLSKSGPSVKRVLATDDLSELFGPEMGAGEAARSNGDEAVKKRGRREAKVHPVLDSKVTNGGAGKRRSPSEGRRKRRRARHL
jgi:uncharacterized Zn finger protein